MAKQLTDKECAEIVSKAVNDPHLIDCADAYKHFLEDLGELIASHFGGDFRSASDPLDNESKEWFLAFDWNDSLPDDGGVFKDLDTDVSIQDWREEAERVCGDCLKTFGDESNLTSIQDHGRCFDCQKKWQHS